VTSQLSRPRRGRPDDQRSDGLQSALEFAFSPGGGLLAFGAGGSVLATALAAASLWIWSFAESRSSQDYTYEDYKVFGYLGLLFAGFIAAIALPGLAAGVVLLRRGHAGRAAYLWSIGVGTAAAAATVAIEWSGGSGMLAMAAAAFLGGGLRRRDEDVGRPPDTRHSARGLMPPAQWLPRRRAQQHVPRPVQHDRRTHRRRSF
jgi:hypothetical protein